MQAIGFGATDTGKKRDGNEDAFFVDDDLGLYVVSDGMGGHAAGEVASAMAVETVADAIRSQAELVRRVREGKADTLVLGPILDAALQQAARSIYSVASSDETRSGMGCTITALIVVGRKAIMAHAGDSRLYMARGDHVFQLSHDHTLANELAQAGHIQPEEVKGHKFAHILTRAVGTQEGVQVESLIFDVLPDDRFVLCSDGLGDYVETPNDLLPFVRKNGVNDLPDRLIEFANESGGKDNVTAVAIAIEGGEHSKMAQEVSHFTAMSRVPMFERLSMRQRLRVFNAFDAKHYPEGETVVAEGETFDSLLVVGSGQVQVEDSDERLTPGTIIGLNTVMHPDQSSKTLVAAEPSTVLHLEQMALRKLARQRPRLGARLFQRIATLLARGDDRLL